MWLSKQLKKYPVWLVIAVVALVVFAETSIPYWYADRHTPAGYRFLGQVAYTPDQNMYFSFISQARDGSLILNNKLTYLPNKPVFVNLEFWLAGFIQRLTGVSENAIYQVWRYWGALLLAIGIFMLVKIALPTYRRQVGAALLLLFSGGFGFFFALLSSARLIGFDATQWGILDMRYGLLPFQQILTNPHFSFPHGLILIAYTYYLKGERTNISQHYITSGLFFIIIGLVRPYDIIPPVIIFPLFALVREGGFRLNTRGRFIKMLPLFMIVPVFLYNVWLFRYNDIFRYWGQQGLNAGSLPSPLWHYLAYGIIGILAIARVFQARMYPLTKTERFLIVWFGVTFVFIHLGKVIPAIGWSPQIGVYLAVPLALLGCSLRSRVAYPAKAWYYGPASIVAFIALAGNISIVLYFTKNFTDPGKTAIYYARNEEVEAWQWLKNNTGKGSVVLAAELASQRIAKYSSASVVAAHYSVTPRFAATEAQVNDMLAHSISNDQLPLLSRLNVDYIYIGPGERKNDNMQVKPCQYLAAVFTNSLVTIYRVSRGKP